MDSLSIPTSSALPSTQLTPSSHPSVQRTLYRLSRSSLISLVLDWLDDRNQENVAPHLAHPADEPDEQDPYPPAQSLAELREVYHDLQARKGSKRDVVDRVIEGDFRGGITLYQLAMADMQYLYDHPLSQKWTALKVVRLQEDDSDSRPTSLPRFHPSTFLRNLQREVLPDVKAHFNLDRHATLPLTILRIFIVESPYNTAAALVAKQQAASETSRTFYIAFPDASPYLYISLLPPTAAAAGQSTSRADNKSLRKLMLDGIPRAFSKPRERYGLENTNLSARNLEALVDRRGPNGTNAAGGGWGIYAEEKKGGLDNPLNAHLPTPATSVEAVDVDNRKVEATTGFKRAREEDERVVKRRKLVAKVRFGNSGIVDDGKGIERLDIRMEDPFPKAVVPATDALEESSININNNTTKKNKKGRKSSALFDHPEIEGEASAAEGWKPDIRFTFHGSHIHAGMRELVEAGIVDGEKMPGWMTGEEGVSIGAVRRGRIRGYKGSGV